MGLVGSWDYSGTCATIVVGLGETSGSCGISGSCGTSGLVRLVGLMELNGLVELH
jgi:hypothetical protein